ncbi:MAG: TIM barrel protein [Desulfobacterales bacterium]|nr:MAG: TIM barrel protein [Desulfobacterales bacterium]
MVRVGPAGSGGLGNLEGVRKVARMGLDCMEVEFTYGVRMNVDDARTVGALAQEKGIVLSAHAPYYINLASDEKDKVLASKKRLIDSCERAHALGARCVVFHAGFYQKRTKGQTYDLVKKAILEIQDVIKIRKWKVQLCPEITGKPSQFGSVSELTRLMQDSGCGITVDFAHLYARQQGKIDYAKLLKKLPKKFHAHFSGIEYGEKGEKKHVVTKKIFFEPLAKQLIKRKLDVTLINESPQPFKDAAMMKKVLDKLRSS